MLISNNIIPINKIHIIIINIFLIVIINRRYYII